MQKKICLKTKDRYELVNITPKIKKFVKESGIKNGLLIVYVPHVTAAIVINEDEEGLKNDFLAIPKLLEQSTIQRAFGWFSV